jgi:S-(hydroxymethyl)glutathione dehydrogenase/alcohol dehydrogenase
LKKKFKGIVLFGKNKFKLIKDINLPNQLPENKILVKIFYSGICRSQIMEINGNRGKDKFLPHLMGHEATGQILECGKKIKDFKKGDKVLLTWICSRNSKSKGVKFNFDNIKINGGPIYTFADKAVIAADRCIKVKKNFPIKEGVLFGCAVQTGMGMVLNESKVRKNDNVLLVGMGGVGFFVYAALKYIKIKNIHILENNKNKLNIIKNFQKNNVFKSIDQIKNKNILFDYCFDTSGSVVIIENCLKFLKNNGKLIFASHPKTGSVIRVDPFDLIKGKKILGSWGGASKPVRDVFKYLNILRKLNFLKHLNTKVYKLINFKNAIRDMKKGKILRPIIDCK